MIVEKLVSLANTLADEQEATTTVMEYMNDAMAVINIKVKANLPFLDTPLSEPVFSEKWQRALLVPYAVGRIKQQDASQFEYTDAYAEFQNNLMEFAIQYVVPDIYKEDPEFNESLRPGLYENKPYGWSF